MFNWLKKQNDTTSTDTEKIISASNSKITIVLNSIVSQEECKCRNKCPNYYDKCSDAQTADLTYINVIIENNTNETESIHYDVFQVSDNEGFVHNSIQLCTKYSEEQLSHIKIPPYSKCKCSIYFKHINVPLDRLFFNAWNKSDNIILNLSGKDNVSRTDVQQKIIEGQLSTIEELNNEIKQLKEQIRNLRQDSSNTSLSEHIKSKRINENSLVKYEIIEDDEYYRIISKEQYDTISFNREFDKSKENHNWINVGDPLITMKVDNVVWGLNAPTIIKSPVSGLFESQNNKMIRFDEEVCRILKIEAELKTQTLEQIERDEIKLNVLKKERKKMIERETLDELISEGKVFNVYTKKDGNRTTISMSIASAVWNRDGGKCCICGCRENLEFDHIIPLSKGGATSFRNLQLLCKDCNTKKSDII